MRRRLPYALPLALSAALLAGCSSEPAEQAAPSPSGTPASEQPTAAASAPPIDGLEVVTEELSRDHQEGAVEYDRIPPVGGPHHPRWLACDVYDEPVPLETAVHSLEHGAVWFAYDPELPQDDVERLAELAERDREYVLVSPMSGLDAPVVAVAWGVSLEATGAGDPRLEELLEAYAGGDQGGEPGVPCRGNGLTLREARGLVQTQAA